MSRRGTAFTFVDENWDWLSILAALGAAVSFATVVLAHAHATPQSVYWYTLFVIGLLLANLVIILFLVAAVGFLAFSRRLILWVFYVPRRNGRS